MSSPESSVDVKGMQDSAQRMRQSMELAKSTKENIQGEVESMLVSFTGAAASQYRNAMTSWYGNVDTIINELHLMIGSMGDGSVEFQRGADDTEDEANSFNSRIASLSGGLAGL
jgi:WXG100 family type VII secretion target